MKMKLALVGAATLAAAFSANTAHAASATADARAVILSAVTLNEVNGGLLDFGKIAASAAGGTVVLNPSTGAVACSGVTCIGTTAPAQFTVSGTSGETVAVSLPTTAVTLTSGGNSMSLGAFTATSSAFALGATPTPFSVGGTLTVGANQAAGVYTGQFNVSVNYQ